MSKAHPKSCEYCGTELDMAWDDSLKCYYCTTCFAAVAVMCPLCGGEGHMPEAEAESDWVNFSDEEIITCPECGGYGWTADPSFQ